jgi:hypothetical protein
VALGNWVRMQRVSHADNKLRLDRKGLLDDVGFVWKAHAAGNNKRKTDKTDKSDKTWHRQYENLVEFKRKNGHCFVPQKYEKDVPLGTWVNAQRGRHANNIMRQDRKELLDEIGFAWKGRGAGNYNKKKHDKYWHQQYEKLVEFKQKNGHCLVPRKEDMSLGLWVSTQRHFLNKSKIRPDRKVLLDEIGFAWKADSLTARRSSTTDVSCR